MLCFRDGRQKWLEGERLELDRRLLRYKLADFYGPTTQVIHKGKVIHPVTGKNASKNNNVHDLSEQLLDITAADLIHRRKKPSLVVMGLRKQTTSLRYRSTLSILFSIARQLSPSYLLNVMTSGVRWTFYAVSTLARGMFLFFQSFLYPPQPQI